MCNAYNLKTRLAAIGEALDRQLGLRLVMPAGVAPEASNMPVPESVYPRRDGLILRPVDPARPGEGLEPLLAHWNLTPFFHKGGLKAWKASTNNARSETMATSPAFRDAYRRRRCLVPATSFTEWTGPKGGKTAHAIGRADGGLIFLAGLWERCPHEGGYAESYTLPMIDAVAGDDVAPFHNRQPVVLDAPGAGVWLDLAADPAPVLRAPAPGTLVADPREPVVG
ncbi:MAG: SOS response-associated peptidase [Caulobacteraceae bacterium]